ncbi:transcriptional regulator [Bordetella phage vB_BbrM_PHB04]|uniref:Transcriptional regulator n=1 Tax=Bordetella phage vB_BbrM_PHB04 TaxID=2029657 RepID=A0A291L9X3_9CAUD|nr:transcriptional regulator [Bordetella phage vB_BbrM_PHB04]ATI15662.1 transcriptional regulator [Bordetella phage vB_BbrM_PHB04]
MNDKNSQFVLSDDEIERIGTHHDVQGPHSFARAIESALLSKLRAPVADERCKRCGGPGWYTSHTTGYPESIPCSACNPQGVSAERLEKDPFLAAQLWRKPVDFADAYEGAREDLAIWKRRALEAERDLRAERETSSHLVAELNAENGPMRMGGPAALASAPVADERAALQRIVETAEDGANSGDRHARCVEIARATLASAPVAGEAQPAAYLTLDEEGSPSMLFFDVVEARTYCELGDEPEPLFRRSALVAGDANPQAPAGWRWTLHPAGLHPDVYAAAAARDSVEDVRNAALEEAAGHIESKKPVGTIALVVQAFADEVRTLKYTPAPTAAEGSQASEAVRDAIETCAKICDGRSASLMQSQMLTASNEAHKCGMAIRSRAKELLSLSLSAQPGAIRNPLIAEPSGELGRAATEDVVLPPVPSAYNDTGSYIGYAKSDLQAYARAAVLADRQRRSGDAPREDDMLTIAYLAGAQAEKERAALAARKEGDDA